MKTTDEWRSELERAEGALRVPVERAARCAQAIIGFGYRLLGFEGLTFHDDGSIVPVMEFIADHAGQPRVREVIELIGSAPQAVTHVEFIYE